MPVTESRGLSTYGGRALPAWARALGEPLATARIRSTPADFLVIEELGFEPCGDGEHDYLFLEKTGQSTERVAGELARFAGVRRAAVGYSGMKDRQAVTRQWFSVPRTPAGAADWQLFHCAGVSVLSCQQHARKLKRGVHRRNRFRLVLRDVEDPSDSLDERLRCLREEGMPNYFGEQRFGWSGGNLSMAESLFAGRRLARHKRSIALSAARSLIFNDVLSARVQDGSWGALQDGDVAGLDGTGSVFTVDAVDDELRSRAAALDLHPTGPLWGAGDTPASGAVAALEAATATQHAGLAAGLEKHTKRARRALRCRIADLEWQADGNVLTLGFVLPRGSFATALLRELVAYAV